MFGEGGDAPVVRLKARMRERREDSGIGLRCRASVRDAGSERRSAGSISSVIGAAPEVFL